MKIISLLFLVFVFGCMGNTQEVNKERLQAVQADTVIVAASDTVLQNFEHPADTANQQISSNERFRKVSITKTDSVFIITGEARVFEATIDWVIEDGQQVVKKGYENADKGAPEWGNFKFTVRLKKPGASQGVKLILYETSANDGSRQFEVPITLY